jgi:hypothetical protein
MSCRRFSDPSVPALAASSYSPCTPCSPPIDRLHCLFTAHSLSIPCVFSLFSAYSLPTHCLPAAYSPPTQCLFSACTAYTLPMQSDRYSNSTGVLFWTRQTRCTHVPDLQPLPRSVFTQFLVINTFPQSTCHSNFGNCHKFT